MNKGSLKIRLFILALLPSLAIAVALGTILTQSRISDYNDFNLQRGQVSSHQLAALAQYALNQGGFEQLQAIANATLEERGVRAVAIYNQQKQEVVHAGPRMLGATPETEQFTVQHHVDTTSHSQRFVAPIYKSLLITDLQLQHDITSTDFNTPIGWVEVEYADAEFVVKKYQTLLISSTITLVTLLICFLFALHLNQKILSAFAGLNMGLERLKQGDLDNRIEIEDQGELSILAENINSMAENVKSSFNDMQHNVEQTTADLRETLETIEIQNIELDLARKEALEASRIKSEFLANTSHEIRTPLNGIIGFTNLLLKSPLSHQQKDYLETVQQSSEGLLTIINDILDFSKIEAGKLVLDHIPINIREIIEETLTMVAPTAQEKNLELVLLIYPDVPTHLIGDPLRIKQVATNLISNAIKFTAQGGIIIRVSLEDSSESQANIVVSVSDTGIGLTPQQQRDIFSAFTQANTSTSREFGGTGLGLVISKRLVEQMGGDIGLESEQGKGSTFWFSLKAKQSERNDESHFQDLKHKRIAIYEPNPVLQLSLKCLLESWHIEPVTLTNDDTFEQDFELLFQYDLDAIILGIGQDKKPHDIYRLLERIPVNTKTPFILLAPSNQWVQQLPLPEGLTIVPLIKPAPHTKLYKALRDLITPSTLSIKTNLVRSTQPTKLPYTPSILAVDDNEANLKLLSVLLNDMGARVVQSSSGLEALREVEKQHFDLIFMDIQMPEMDGVTATARIRELPEPINHTPIIALTAHALTEEREKLLSSGLNDHITKPISEAKLREVIQRWCRSCPENALTQGLVLETASKPLTTPSGLDNNAQQDDKKQAAPNTSSPASTPLESNDTAKAIRPVDVSQCLSLANGKNALAFEMLSMLLEKLDDDIKQTRDAIEKQDYALLLDHVHKLHGATCYTGVPLLREEANLYETAIKQQKTAQLKQRQASLEREIKRIQDWAEEHELSIIFDL
jgi:two-component system sensor histidine kinase BarA